MPLFSSFTSSSILSITPIISATTMNLINFYLHQIHSYFPYITESINRSQLYGYYLVKQGAFLSWPEKIIILPTSVLTFFGIHTIQVKKKENILIALPSKLFLYVCLCVCLDREKRNKEGGQEVVSHACQTVLEIGWRMKTARGDNR